MVADAVLDACRGTVVIVEGEGDGHVGLVVDEMLGQQQVVVKSLETNYDAVDGVGGATILGNGMVSLILDVERLRGSTSAPPAKPSLSAAAAPMTSSSVH